MENAGTDPNISSKHSVPLTGFLKTPTPGLLEEG